MYRVQPQIKIQILINQQQKKKVTKSSMSTSPYIPAQVKEYMRKFSLQQTINTSINQVLKSMPEDPYSFLIGLFQKKSSPDIELLDIKLNQIISGEGFPVISLHVKINYLNQELSFNLYQSYGISGDDNNIFDEGKGMKSAIAFYEEKIRPVLKNKKFKCSQHQSLDSQLVKIYAQHDKKGLYIINSISQAIHSIKSRIFCQPLYNIYSQLVQKNISHDQVPQIFVNLLHGGKAIGSKCKVFKYYLLSTSKQGLSLISTVVQNVKKTITSGKGGQAALKYSLDGTFICPLDTIMDNLKIVEDAINNTPGGKDHLKVGLSWQADTLFGQQTKKYELQNPKTPFDNDQMIEYLIKLLTDKPIITYLQDPLASSQLSSYSKLIKRLHSTDALKHIKIGTRNGSLLNALSDQFKEKVNEISTSLTQDSHPDLTPQQRESKNAIKFSLDFFQIRMTELQTVNNLLKVNKILQKTNTRMILQDNAYETYNTDLIDTSFGLNAVANIGSAIKYDRLTKVYRAIQIVKQRQQNQ